MAENFIDEKSSSGGPYSTPKSTPLSRPAKYRRVSRRTVDKTWLTSHVVVAENSDQIGDHTTNQLDQDRSTGGVNSDEMLFTWRCPPVKSNETNNSSNFSLGLACPARAPPTPEDVEMVSLTSDASPAPASPHPFGGKSSRQRCASVGGLLLTDDDSVFVSSYTKKTKSNIQFTQSCFKSPSVGGETATSVYDTSLLAKANNRKRGSTSASNNNRSRSVVRESDWIIPADDDDDEEVDQQGHGRQKSNEGGFGRVKPAPGPTSGTLTVDFDAGSDAEETSSRPQSFLIVEREEFRRRASVTFNTPLSRRHHRIAAAAAAPTFSSRLDNSATPSTSRANSFGGSLFQRPRRLTPARPTGSAFDTFDGDDQLEPDELENENDKDEIMPLGDVSIGTPSSGDFSALSRSARFTYSDRLQPNLNSSLRVSDSMAFDATVREGERILAAATAAGGRATDDAERAIMRERKLRFLTLCNTIAEARTRLQIAEAEVDADVARSFEALKLELANASMAAAITNSQPQA